MPQEDRELAQPTGNSRFYQTFRGISAIIGITGVASLVFLSRPLMSYFAREMCMSMQPPPSFWPNPFSGLGRVLWSRYQCEWMGHWGFNYYEVFSWLTSSWQAVLGSIGSFTGVWALFRTLRGQNNEHDQNVDNPPPMSAQDKRQVQEFLSAIKQGYLPLYRSSTTGAASEPALSNRLLPLDPDTEVFAKVPIKRERSHTV